MDRPVAAQFVRQALAVGEELLRTLQPPVTDELLAGFDRLSAEREELLRQAVEVASQPGAAPVTPELPGLLAQQQRALEEQVRRLLAAMTSSAEDAQAARSSLQSFNRLMNTGTRSRYFDERR